jgi:hypothetical protein
LADEKTTAASGGKSAIITTINSETRTLSLMHREKTALNKQQKPIWDSKSSANSTKESPQTKNVSINIAISVRSSYMQRKSDGVLDDTEPSYGMTDEL